MILILKAKERVYLYPVNVVEKSSKSTFFQYQDLEIEQIFIPPADWEFITRNSKGEIIDKMIMYENVIVFDVFIEKIKTKK